MIDFDDKDLAILGIVIIFVASIAVMAMMPKDLALQLADKMGTVWGSLAGGLAGIATGKKT